MESHSTHVESHSTHVESHSTHVESHSTHVESHSPHEESHSTHVEWSKMVGSDIDVANGQYTMQLEQLTVTFAYIFCLTAIISYLLIKKNPDTR